MANSRKSDADLSTVTPCCVTMEGRRGVARASRFCTSTWASSGSVPCSKVMVSEPVPLDWATDSMYSKPVAPFISRSITASTLSSSVCAEAPG